MNNYFYLHKWCIPVKGVNRSSISDFQRSSIELIPNELYDILNNYNGKKVTDVYKAYEEIENSKEIIQEYFDFLISKDFIFLSHTKDQNISSLSMNIQYETPYIINSCIIDRNNESKYSMKKLISELNSIGCKSIQLRFYTKVSLDKLKDILTLTDDTIFRSIDLVIKYVDEGYIYELKKMLENGFNRVFTIVIHSSIKKTKVYEESRKKYIFTSSEINSCLSCGEISSSYFDINTFTYLIGLKYNTCLYKKISIDVKGNVKNCPSFPLNLGSVEKKSILEIVKLPQLRIYWTITKNQIETCRNCEFRLVCTDCRAFVENPKNIYSKPLKCGYNPFTNEWEDWSTNPLKKEVMNHYKAERNV
ncbi:grasp-with-spasm system SPASM domain peptide maturase [Flavobacteriaceae bacterium]|nr:grasp-with-spasm system SPASM domain peptide maturase [Flavobacteriaceae bacterium]